VPTGHAPERIAHFRIVRKIGQGGMGIVYRAEDERLRRTVAIKVLPEAFVQDAERRRRFLREARAAAALTHANIATVHDVAEEDGRVFLVMELVEGQSLRERISRGKVPAGETIRVARGIARGLARAHAKGIVHRDLKPDNVVIDSDGEPKILDFGLAKLREAEASQGKSVLEGAETESIATEEGRTLGTPQYMSPEQARGDAVDGRSDVFSLGVVLYEMLVGRRPFAGRSSAELIAAILRDGPEPVRRLAPDVPDEIASLVERCLAKSPAERFASARELLDALEAIETSGSRVRSQAGIAVAATPRRRSRGWLLASLVALIGATAAIGLRLHAGEKGAPSSSPSASNAAAASASASSHHDWPPPKTSSPEAAAVYAEAMQALHDASAEARQSLRRACELDPHFAAANLRLALWLGTLKESRDHLAAATQSRALLDARDQRLLAFAEAWRNDDPSKVVELAKAFSHDSGDDAEMQFWAGQALQEMGALADAVATLDLALHLDPSFAGALARRVAVKWNAGDVNGALTDADACVTLAPSAVTCLSLRARFASMGNDCDAMEDYARRVIAIAPSWRGYDTLWSALAARGAPHETLAQLDRAGEALAQGADARRLKLEHAARLAARFGDFTTAEANLQSLRSELATETDEFPDGSTADLLSLYAEEGNTAKAAALAQDWLQRLPTLIHGRPAIFDFMFDTPLARGVGLAALRRSGQLSADQVRSLRDAWQKEWVGGLLPDLRGHAWTWFYAYPAETAADAREALDALPAYAPLPPDTAHPAHAGARGKVYALAGDVDTAIPLLHQEVDQCGEGPVTRTPNGMWWMRSTMQNRVLLAQMLERKGDTAGACAQYGAVLRRWASAKPRSLTAEQAKAGSTRLGCR